MTPIESLCGKFWSSDPPLCGMSCPLGMRLSLLGTPQTKEKTGFRIISYRRDRPRLWWFFVIQEGALMILHGYKSIGRSLPPSVVESQASQQSFSLTFRPLGLHIHCVIPRWRWAECGHFHTSFLDFKQVFIILVYLKCGISTFNRYILKFIFGRESSLWGTTWREAHFFGQIDSIDRKVIPLPLRKDKSARVRSNA